MIFETASVISPSAVLIGVASLLLSGGRPPALDRLERHRRDRLVDRDRDLELGGGRVVALVRDPERHLRVAALRGGARIDGDVRGGGGGEASAAAVAAATATPARTTWVRRMMRAVLSEAGTAGKVSEVVAAYLVESSRRARERTAAWIRRRVCEVGDGGVRDGAERRDREQADRKDVHGRAPQADRVEGEQLRVDEPGDEQHPDGREREPAEPHVPARGPPQQRQAQHDHEVHRVPGRRRGCRGSRTARWGDLQAVQRPGVRARASVVRTCSAHTSVHRHGQTQHGQRQ